jgi:hypothetical protein
MEEKTKISSLVESPISVTEIFPCGQVNIPLDYSPLYQYINNHLDTTILIKSFLLSKKRGEGEVGCTMFTMFVLATPVYNLDPISGANQYLQ